MTVRVPLAVALRAAGAPSARSRALLFVLVGLLSAATLLVPVSAYLVREREGARAARLEPVHGAPGERGLASTSLVIQHRGRQAMLVRIADTGSSVLPPGLDALPAPGDAVVSPALQALAARDERVAGWFGGDVAILDRSGVGSAGELRAYIGVRPTELGAVDDRPIVGFGSGSRPVGLGWYETIGLAVFVALPGIGMLITASRFGRPIRHARQRALRVAGMGKISANLTSGLEMALPASMGASVAAAGWAMLLPDRMTLPVADRPIFGADASPPGLVAVAIVVLVAVLAGAVSAATASRPLGLAAARSLVGRRWRLLTGVGAFGTGLALVGGAWLRREPRDPLLWVGLIAAGVGLPSATATVSRAVASAVSVRRASITRLISVRRVQSDSLTASRIAGTVAIAVLVLIAARPISEVIASPNPPWLALARQAGEDRLLSRAETLENVPLTLAVDRPPGVATELVAVGLWTPAQATTDRPATSALIGTCEQLEALVRVRLQACLAEPMLLRTLDSPAVATDEFLLRNRARDVVRTLAPPSETLELPETTLPLDTSILLPPEALRSSDDLYITAAYFRVDATQESWEEARAWITRSNPAFRLENAYEASFRPDTTTSWVLLGLLSTAVITTLAAVMAGFDETSRRREWRALRAVGMTRKQIIQIHASEATLVGGIAVSLALLATITATLAFLRVGDEEISLVRSFAIAASGFAVIVVASTLAALLATSADRALNYSRRSSWKRASEARPQNHYESGSSRQAWRVSDSGARSRG